MKNLPEYIHSGKWVYIICFLTLGLEIYLVLSLFYDLPDSANSKFYWTIVAVVVCGVELYIIMQLKKAYYNREWLKVIGYALVYGVTLCVLFLAALGYNLKAVEGKAQTENINNLNNSFIMTEISNNSLAISKYNGVIGNTNDMWVIQHYRNMINELSSNNTALFSEIQSGTNIEQSKNKDAFTLISEKTAIPRNSLVFCFLSGIWALLAFIMLITAPGGKPVKPETMIDLAEENNLDYISHRWQLFDKWIHMIPSNDYAISKLGIARSISRRFREILSSIYSVEGEKKTPLVDMEKGTLNYGANKILSAISKKLNR